MPISPYLKNLRDHVGTTLLLLPAVAAVIHDEDSPGALARSCRQQLEPSRRRDSSRGKHHPRLLFEVWEETGLHVAPERILGVFGGRDSG